MIELNTPEQEPIVPRVIVESDSIVVSAQPFTHGHLTQGMVDLALLGARSNTLIGEYFGPDMDEFFKQGLRLKSRQGNTAVVELELALNENGVKPKVICLDPAHNLAWATLNMGLEPEAVIVSGPPALGMGIQAHKENKGGKISRRNFLIGASAAGLSASALAITAFIQKYFGERVPQTPGMVAPNPQHLRRLVIAKNILALDRLINKPKPGAQKTNLLLLYPEVHIQGIQALLNKRDWNFADEQIANALLQISDFSTARIYKPIVNENGQTVWDKSSINLHKK